LTIDFHSHILPQIDDGSKNADTSIEMLKCASGQSVDLMIATPHFYASKNTIDAFLRGRNEAYEKLSARIQGEGDEKLPELKLGAEVAYFDGISRAERINELAIEGTDLLLLELPFCKWNDGTVKEVRDLMAKRKLRVILAHLERYMGLHANRKYLKELTELPVLVQINAESLSRRFEGRKLCRMFSDGKAHLLGSDCHGITHRVPNLGAGREIIKKRCGAEVLREIDERGARILEESS
jgi:protein-tyrosine phosphatase